MYYNYNFKGGVKEVLKTSTDETHKPLGPRISESEPLSEIKKIYEDIKQLINNRKEYSVDNFNNLTVDEKLTLLYEIMTVKFNEFGNYILLCLIILVILALKVFSK